MTPNIPAIETFIAESKFAEAAWARRGLNPSPPAFCARLESLLNAVADQVLAQARSGASKSEIKRTLVAFVRKMSRSAFDTEEAELFCAEVDRLSGFLEVDVSASLNRWLYGYVVGIIVNMSRKPKG